MSYPDHHAKANRAPHSRPQALGYDLACALLVDAQTGDPLAPVQLELTPRGVLSTHADRAESLAHIDQVLQTMHASRSWELDKPLVHVIDREADGLARFRAWSAAGHLFLVRVNDRRRVSWRGQKPLVAGSCRDAFRLGPGRAIGVVLGAGETLWVAQAAVGYDRAARAGAGGDDSAGGAGAVADAPAGGEQTVSPGRVARGGVAAGHERRRGGPRGRGGAVVRASVAGGVVV